MAKNRNINLSLSETSQEIDLKDLLGRKPKPAEKEAFVQAAINRIIERSQSNKNINNRKFAKYSKDYAEKKGVSRDDVDMTLDGDMLLSIKRLRASGDKVKFGIKGGVDAKKSYNHNVGDTLPKREYFGLNLSEMKSIAKDIKQADLGKFTVSEIREQIINQRESAVDDNELIKSVIESLVLTQES